MAAKWIEWATGSLEQKKQYRRDRARMDALPEPYRAAAKAYHRYFLYFGGITDGDTLVTMFTEFADLWERAAADGTPLRAIVGDDPVGFGEDFVRAYLGREWIDKERERLVRSIDEAEKRQARAAEGSGS